MDPRNMTAEDMQRILYNRAWKEFTSAENCKRIEQYAREKGISFEEALFERAELELEEPPESVLSGVSPEDAALDRAAQRYASEQGVSYDVALEEVLNELPDAPAAPMPSADADAADKSRIHEKALKLAEREGIPYPEAFDRVLEEER